MIRNSLFYGFLNKILWHTHTHATHLNYFVLKKIFRMIERVQCTINIILILEEDLIAIRWFLSHQTNQLIYFCFIGNKLREVNVVYRIYLVWITAFVCVFCGLWASCWAPLLLISFCGLLFKKKTTWLSCLSRSKSIIYNKR